MAEKREMWWARKDASLFEYPFIVDESFVFGLKDWTKDFDEDEDRPTRCRFPDVLWEMICAFLFGHYTQVTVLEQSVPTGIWLRSAIRYCFLCSDSITTCTRPAVFRVGVFGMDMNPFRGGTIRYQATRFLGYKYVCRRPECLKRRLKDLDPNVTRQITFLSLYGPPGLTILRKSSGLNRLWDSYHRRMVGVYHSSEWLTRQNLLQYLLTNNIINEMQAVKILHEWLSVTAQGSDAERIPLLPNRHWMEGTATDLPSIAVETMREEAGEDVTPFLLEWVQNLREHMDEDRERLEQLEERCSLLGSTLATVVFHGRASIETQW